MEELKTTLKKTDIVRMVQEIRESLQMALDELVKIDEIPTIRARTELRKIDVKLLHIWKYA